MDALMTRFLRSPALYKIPIPKPKSTELLIKVAFVSLNPTDYKHASASLPPSKILGCDFSGTVQKLGDAVDRSKFSAGDRIAGLIHGCKDTHTGAFAEYLVADANLCYKIPGNVSLEKASTLGVGWISAMQALRKYLYSEKIGSDLAGETLLVYSAATNMGMHTVQQARIYYPKITIIALASARHHEYLRTLGADQVFDYSSPTVVEDVRKLGKDIRSGIDCHSEGRSTYLTAQCMLPVSGNDSSSGKDRRRIIRSLPIALIKGTIPPSVRADEWILSYTALGKPFRFLFTFYPANPEDYKSSSDYLQALTPLLQEQKVIPVKHRLMSGGLGQISEGFEEMKSGKVRGEKLVYQVGGEE